MRFLLWTFFTILFLIDSKAQIITILDKTNGAALPGVLVFEGRDNIIGTSNHEGKMLATGISKTDTLYFKLFGYESKTLRGSEVFDQPVYLSTASIDLDEVVVSSSRWAEDIKFIPQQIKRIMPSEINRKDPMTMADALASTGQVFIQKSQLGGGSPMLRGFSANKILLSVDGIRMNNAIYRSGNIQNIISMDANSLDNMEVIYGPGSVIYGSDALGGVIAMNTRNPELSIDSAILMYGGGFARFSSANYEKTIGVDLNIGRKRWASFTQITLSDFEDLRSGGNYDPRDPDFGKREFYVKPFFGRDSIVKNEDVRIQVPSGYRQANLLQKFKFLLKGQTSLDASLILSNSSDIPRYDRLTIVENGLPKSAEWYYGPQFFLLSSLGLNLGPGFFYKKARITLAYQRVIEERNDRGYQSIFLRQRKELLNIFSLNADFQEKINHQHEFNFGIEGFYNHVASEAQSQNIISNQVLPAATRYPDGGSDYYSLAAYLNYIFKMRKGFNLNTGIRLNYVGLNSKFEDSSFYNFPFREISLGNGAVTGSLGLKKSWESRSNVYFNLGSGFRAPNVDDVAKVFDSEPGNVVVPNPTLKPEYVINSELGFSKIIKRTLVLRGNVFYSLWIDAIIRADYSINGQDSLFYDGQWGNIQAEQNLGQAQLAGAFGQIEWHPFPWGKIESSLTYTWGEAEDGAPLRHVTPVFGNTAIEFIKSDWTTRVDFYYSGGIPFAELAPREQAKAYIYSSEGALSWWILNFTLARKISNKADLQVIVENILDRQYRPYSSGISAPGLNFRASARVYF
jgi:outer membrane receptor protein involved in Fe transport